MPGTLDKIFGPFEEKMGSKIRQDIYSSDPDLAEGEKRDPKDQSNIKGGVGFDTQDKKPFIYAEGKKANISAGAEAKSKDEYSANIGYDINDNTKVRISTDKDKLGKQTTIGIRKTFNKGGSILAKGNKLAKHKPTKLY